MDLPDSDQGDFSCRRAVDSSSFGCTHSHVCYVGCFIIKCIRWVSAGKMKLECISNGVTSTSFLHYPIVLISSQWIIFAHIISIAMNTLENRYGFWPQTGCVLTVPGCEAALLVARQRLPYRSRFNFSVKNMENMLPCNALCDIMHIDFSRKIILRRKWCIHWLLIEVH